MSENAVFKLLKLECKKTYCLLLLDMKPVCQNKE